MGRIGIIILVIFGLLGAQAQDIQYDIHENDINLPIDESLVLPEKLPDFRVPPVGYSVQRDYRHIDPTHIISSQKLSQALAYYDFNFEKISNKDYLGFIDFSLRADQRRYFLIDMRSGRVQPMLVAVGVGSDPDGDGVANSFSNIEGSKMSSLGFYYTGAEYMGGNGRSLYLYGLSETNSRVFERHIVVHGATYVSEADNIAGRSHGCPAVDMKLINDVINKIKSGSLMLIVN